MVKITRRETAEGKKRRVFVLVVWVIIASLSGSELKRRHCRIYGNNINIIICRFNFHITFGFFRVFVFCFLFFAFGFPLCIFISLAFSSPSQAQRNSGCQVMQIGDVLS